MEFQPRIEPSTTCSSCRRGPASSQRRWATPKPANPENAAARTLARDVTARAVRHHQRHKMGFVYTSRGGRISVNDAAYVELLRVVGRLNFYGATEMRPGAVASYRNDLNLVNYQPGSIAAPATASTMLHEVVHAWQDISRFVGLHAEIESTAYLAQALWLAGEYTASGVFKTLHQFLETQVASKVTTGDSRIFPAAAGVCLSLGLHKSVRPISRSDLAPVERALRASETYRDFADESFAGDGLTRNFSQ